MRPRFLSGAAPTYQPFPLPPELDAVPAPIKLDIFQYSSTGFTVMNYRPKRPSELVAAMTEQYEERELDQFGREIRGGPGKKKGKAFFRAHLTWYGFEYNEDDTRKELEEQLWEAMTARPPPSLPQDAFVVEAYMRQMWLSAAAEHQELIRNIRAQRGELIVANTLAHDFFDNPRAFFRTHFPTGVSSQHVVVLESVDDMAEIQILEWACDVYGLLVEKVENDRGRGRNRGRFPDFVIGKNTRVVRAKANEIRRENGPGGARFRPY